MKALAVPIAILLLYSCAFCQAKALTPQSKSKMLASLDKDLDRIGRKGIYKDLHWVIDKSTGGLYVTVTVRPKWYLLEMDGKKGFAQMVDAYCRLKTDKLNSPPTLMMFEDSRTGKEVARYSKLGFEVF